jgi:succinate dehydrogenase / fumarate reductase cytochrome b subunit
MEPNAACPVVPVAGSVSSTAYNHPLLQAQSEPKPGCKCGVLRPPRKCHAAVGLWLAVFLGVHFSIGLTGITPHNYEGAVGLLHRSLSYFPGAVFLLVFLPMLIQAGSGLYLLTKEGLRFDVKSCNRGGKLRYFLQRWSGLAMLVFLLLHIATMRGRGLSLVGHGSATRLLRMASAGAPDGTAFAYTVSGFHPWNSPVMDSITIAFLLLGILATVFHVANGACSGGILWKVVQSDRGKAWLNCVSLVAGLALADLGCLAWYAFSLSPNVHAVLAAAGR